MPNHSKTLDFHERGQHENRFLLEITKELIRNTESYRKIFIELGVKRVIQQENLNKNLRIQAPRKAVKQFVRRKIERDFQTLSEQQPLEKNIFKDFFKKLEVKKVREKLTIPETTLPQTFQYLMPQAFSADIDLKKIGFLIKDPVIKVIECGGPNQEIIVEGSIGRRKTKIVLTKTEIDDIINTFSEAAKIPVNEGLYKVVYGDLILSAVVSQDYSSKFLISKISQQSQQFYQQQTQKSSMNLGVPSIMPVPVPSTIKK